MINEHEMFVNENKNENCPGYIEKKEIITQFNHKKKKESSLFIVKVTGRNNCEQPSGA